MAKQLPSTNITREERTFRVERETPVGGTYYLRIHREIIGRDAVGTVISRETRTDAYNESAAKAATRPAFTAYLAALKSANNAADVIAAESALYDALVEEVDAEKAAQVTP